MSSFLQSLFSNEKIKDLALVALKKQMIENNIKHVVIELLPSQEIDLKIYATDMVVYSREQADKIRQVMIEQEAILLNNKDLIRSLVAQAEKLTVENEALYASNGEVSETPVPGPIEAISIVNKAVTAAISNADGSNDSEIAG